MIIKKERLPILKILIFGFWPSFIKIVLYKLKGYKIGKGVKLSIGSLIIGKDVHLGEKSRIGFFTIIRAKKIKLDRYVSIGSFCFIDTGVFEIGEDSKIRENVYVGGILTSESRLKIGSRCGIWQGTFINPTLPVIIGNDSGIGGNCQIFTHGSWLSQLDGFPVTFKQIIIGNNVWIPWNVFLLPGSEIGDNVVIGASSLIDGKLPSNSLAFGIPARVKAKNFPIKPSENEQQIIMNNIISDFRIHLGYYGFEVLSEEKSEDRMSMIIKYKKSKYEFIYQKHFSPETFLEKKHVLVILNSVDLREIMANIACNSILCIENKSRLGKSDIGDEFISFASRYGIHFKRLD